MALMQSKDGISLEVFSGDKNSNEALLRGLRRVLSSTIKLGKDNDNNDTLMCKKNNEALNETTCDVMHSNLQNLIRTASGSTQAIRIILNMGLLMLSSKGSLMSALSIYLRIVGLKISTQKSKKRLSFRNSSGLSSPNVVITPGRSNPRAGTSPPGTDDTTNGSSKTDQSSTLPKQSSLTLMRMRSKEKFKEISEMTPTKEIDILAATNTGNLVIFQLQRKIMQKTTNGPLLSASELATIEHEIETLVRENDVVTSRRNEDSIAKDQNLSACLSCTQSNRPQFMNNKDFGMSDFTGIRPDRSPFSDDQLNNGVELCEELAIFTIRMLFQSGIWEAICTTAMDRRLSAKLATYDNRRNQKEKTDSAGYYRKAIQLFNDIELRTLQKSGAQTHDNLLSDQHYMNEHELLYGRVPYWTTRKKSLIERYELMSDNIAAHENRLYSRNASSVMVEQRFAHALKAADNQLRQMTAPSVVSTMEKIRQELVEDGIAHIGDTDAFVSSLYDGSQSVDPTKLREALKEWQECHTTVFNNLAAHCESVINDYEQMSSIVNIRALIPTGRNKKLVYYRKMLEHHTSKLSEPIRRAMSLLHQQLKSTDHVTQVEAQEHFDTVTVGNEYNREYEEVFLIKTDSLQDIVTENDDKVIDDDESEGKVNNIPIKTVTKSKHKKNKFKLRLVAKGLNEVNSTQDEMIPNIRDLSQEIMKWTLERMTSGRLCYCCGDEPCENRRTDGRCAGVATANGKKNRNLAFTRKKALESAGNQ